MISLFDFVALDIETTGFDFEKDEIIEIGAVRYISGKIKDKFSIFIKPQKPVPQFIKQLTNITDEQLNSGDTISNALSKLLEFLGTDLVVCHNTSFDIGFLNTKYEKIIVNSLDFFLSQYPQTEVIRTIQATKISNLSNKGVLYIIMTRGIHGDVFERRMESMADCILELEVLQKGSNFERFLAVKKMKNYAKKIGIARYTIDSDGLVLEMIERIM